MLSNRTPLRAISNKPKKCAVRSCRAPFLPKRTFQTWCSDDCALVIARARQETERKAIEQRERRELKARKEKLKSRADHMKAAQDAFNTYIRQRDLGQPCISCGTTARVQYAAGHYRTVGACPELRFEPLNVHLQCNKNCNKEKSGNIVEYRIRLVQKIGAEKVAWLEGPHEPKKYSIEDLKAIKAHYRALTRQLRQGNGGRICTTEGGCP